MAFVIGLCLPSIIFSLVQKALKPLPLLVVGLVMFLFPIGIMFVDFSFCSRLLKKRFEKWNDGSSSWPDPRNFGQKKTIRFSFPYSYSLYTYTFVPFGTHSEASEPSMNGICNFKSIIQEPWNAIQMHK